MSTPNRTESEPDEDSLAKRDASHRAGVDDSDGRNPPLDSESVELSRDEVAFLSCCRSGDLKSIRGLVRRRSFCSFDVRELEWPRSGALHLACLFGHLPILEFLVGLGSPDIESVDGDRWTPLFCACDRGHVEIIEFLLSDDIGANSTHCSSQGENVIHRAVSSGHRSVVSYLSDRLSDRIFSRLCSSRDIEGRLPRDLTDDENLLELIRCDNPSHSGNESESASSALPNPMSQSADESLFEEYRDRFLSLFRQQLRKSGKARELKARIQKARLRMKQQRSTHSGDEEADSDSGLVSASASASRSLSRERLELQKAFEDDSATESMSESDGTLSPVSMDGSGSGSGSGSSDRRRRRRHRVASLRDSGSGSGGIRITSLLARIDDNEALLREQAETIERKNRETLVLMKSMKELQVSFDENLKLLVEGSEREKKMEDVYEGQILDLEKERDEFTKALRDLEGDMDQQQSAHEERIEQLNVKSRKSEEELRNQIATIRNDEAAAREKLAKQVLQSEELLSERERLKDDLDSLRSTHTTALQEHDVRTKELTAIWKKKVADAEEKYRTTLSRAGGLQEQFEALAKKKDDQIDRLRAEVAKQKRELGQATQDVAPMKEREETLLAEKAALNQRLLESAGQVEELRGLLDQKRDAVAAAEKQTRLMQNEVLTVREELMRIRKSAGSSLAQQHADLQARVGKVRKREADLIARLAAVASKEVDVTAREQDLERNSRLMKEQIFSEHLQAAIDIDDKGAREVPLESSESMGRTRILKRQRSALAKEVLGDQYSDDVVQVGMEQVAMECEKWRIITHSLMTILCHVYGVD